MLALMRYLAFLGDRGAIGDADADGTGDGFGRIGPASADSAGVVPEPAVGAVTDASETRSLGDSHPITMVAAMIAQSNIICA